jgi:hypothetical protein
MFHLFLIARALVSKHHYHAQVIARNISDEAIHNDKWIASLRSKVTELRRHPNPKSLYLQVGFQKYGMVAERK